MAIVLQLCLNALIAGAVYALIASGLSFIYATTRVFHLAHGVVVAFGGYLFWFVWQALLLPWPIALLASGFGAGLLGVCMNELVYEPLRRRRTKGLGYLVCTVALLMLGNAALLALFGSSPKTLGVETQVFDLFGARISVLQMILIGACAMLLVALHLFVNRTRFGRAMRATASQETMAEVLGVNTRLIRRRTFFLGSVFGGLAGVLVALETNLDPNMGTMLVIKGFAGSVMGGTGSMAGAVVGSAILGVAEQAAAWLYGSGWKSAVAFVLLFVFLLVRPQGMFGKKRTA